MSIAVVCPKCQSRLNAPDGAAGKAVQCPRCKQPMTIPASFAHSPAPQPASAFDFSGIDTAPGPTRRTGRDGRSGMWIGIGIGADLAAIGIVVAIVIATGGKSSNGETGEKDKRQATTDKGGDVKPSLDASKPDDKAKLDTDAKAEAIRKLAEEKKGRRGPQSGDGPKKG